MEKNLIYFGKGLLVAFFGASAASIFNCLYNNKPIQFIFLTPVGLGLTLIAAFLNGYLFARNKSVTKE